MPPGQRGVTASEHPATPQLPPPQSVGLVLVSSVVAGTRGSGGGVKTEGVGQRWGGGDASPSQSVSIPVGPISTQFIFPLSVQLLSVPIITSLILEKHAISPHLASLSTAPVAAARRREGPGTAAASRSRAASPGAPTTLTGAPPGGARTRLPTPAGPWESGRASGRTAAFCLRVPELRCRRISDMKPTHGVSTPVSHIRREIPVHQEGGHLFFFIFASTPRSLPWKRRTL